MLLACLPFSIFGGTAVREEKEWKRQEEVVSR